MSEVAPRQDRTLEDIADVWDLTPHELDRLAAERHINACARLRRTRQPPENSRTARCSSAGLKPSPLSRLAARLLAW